MLRPQMQVACWAHSRSGVPCRPCRANACSQRAGGGLCAANPAGLTPAHSACGKGFAACPRSLAARCALRRAPASCGATWRARGLRAMRSVCRQALGACDGRDACAQGGACQQ